MNHQEYEYGITTTGFVESRLPRFTECIDNESECVSIDVLALDDTLKTWLWWFVCAAFAENHKIVATADIRCVANGFEFELFEALATELAQ